MSKIITSSLKSLPKPIKKLHSGITPKLHQGSCWPDSLASLRRKLGAVGGLIDGLCYGRRAKVPY